MTSLPPSIPDAGVHLALGISVVTATPDLVVVSVPVTSTVHQPFGILHGGVSALLAESAASIGGSISVPDGKVIVGTELNCSHLRSMTSGTLTATATPEVRKDIARVLGLRDPEVVLTGFDRPNLRWHVVRTKNDAEKDGTLVSILSDRPGLAVVYASTRKTVERVASMLQKHRISAVAYHAGLDDERRRTVQDDFMQERARVIVATNAFGMGIDKANVRLVVHHAMPGSLEAYYQEAGRAGRDGLTADCFLLHAFQDRFTHEFFIRGASPEKEVVADVYATACRKSAADGSLALDSA